MQLKNIILGFGICLLPVMATAQSFTLHDNSSGASYQCGPGGGTDPACVSSVSDYCNQHTSYTSNQCFQKSSTACGGSGSGFAACVTSTTDYCNQHTSNTSNQCFDLTLGSCRGSAVEMQAILESVRTESLNKALGLKAK
jgi:hypothetical protein